MALSSAYSDFPDHESNGTAFEVDTVAGHFAQHFPAAPRYLARTQLLLAEPFRPPGARTAVAAWAGAAYAGLWLKRFTQRHWFSRIFP